MNKLSIAAGALLFAASQGALAQASAQPRWYAGFGAGAVSNNFSSGSIPIAASSASTLSKDRYDSIGSVYGGYQFTPNLAAEVGYVGIGPTGATRTATAPGPGALTYSNRTNAWMFSGVGSTAISDKWQLFGRFGAAYTETKSSITSSGIAPVPANPNPRVTEWNWLVGAGVSFNVTPRVSLVGEYTRIATVGDSQTTEHPLSLWSAGLKFRF